MLLKSIEIQGFKSFADKVTLHFGKGITAVVGPNGSGKSNISDAVRWVLGEQSTKTLRGHKMEDVIFGGTAQRRPQGFAEVTLTIDNSDRRLNFDNDTVSVTRRYYRSGESEYQINKATVLLKNIHELFMDTGLGRDGYSMIGQGKIDSIVASKSGERRDIFEEAAGISKYRYRKLEAERKLERAEENLLRLKDILTELEERVGPLEEQSKKAEAFLALSEEKKNLEIGLWLLTLSKAGELLAAQEEKIAQAGEHYRQTELALDGIDAKSAALTEEMQRLSAQMDEARRAVAKAEENCTRKEGEIAVLENTAYHNGESIARIEREAEELGQTDTEAQREAERLTVEAETKRTEMDAAQRRLTETNEDLQALISGSEGISRQIEELVRSVSAISGEISDWRVKMVTAQSSAAEIETRGETDSEQAEKNQSETAKLSAELKALDADAARTLEEITSLRNALGGYELRRKARQEAETDLQAQVNTLSLDIGEKQRRIRILEDLEKNMEGFSGAVKAVMGESAKSALTGIHGPVSRLIRVEKQYAAAIEIALGYQVQHVVVDREGDAKRAIAYLKERRLGRATFLPIATIRGRRLPDAGVTELDGIVGIASELAACDEQYREIIRNLLGNTVVARDLDAATAAAKRYGYRFKVVTLDGQVVNAGGSLTGGSVLKNAGLLGRSEEIARLRTQTQALEQRAKERQAELEAACAEREQAERRIKEQNALLTTAGEDLIRIEGEQRRVKGQMDSLRQAALTLEAEQASAKNRLEELNATAAEAALKIAALERKAASAQGKIDEATGGRNRLSEQREQLSAKAGDWKLQISLLQKDMDNSLSAARQIRQAAGDRAMRRTALDAEIAELNRKNTEIAVQIDTIKAEIESERSSARDTQSEIERLSKARMECERQANELRVREKERTEDKEKLSGELARLTERRVAMEKEHDDIIARLFDEYGLTRSEAEQSGIRVEEPAAAKRRLDELKGQIRRLGSVNVGAIEEYKEVRERYEFMRAQIEDVERSREELHRLIRDLTAQMEQQFLDGFQQIGGHFTQVFTELFGGGKGELQLSDPGNLLESGIEIVVQPPGKKVSTIELLSGGEKALIALSIYFSIMKVNPPPFCMLDEVETALDDINVDRFAEYLHKMGDNTQFICITHRRGTMEQADMLYGVTMQEKGVSKLLELNVAELEQNLALAQ